MDARARVEEMVFLIYVDRLHRGGVPVVVVVDAPCLVMHIAVLHVGEQAQPPGDCPVGAHEDVGVLFVDIVVVPAPPDVAFLQAVHPVQRAPVGTGVIAPRTAEREVEVAYRIGCRGVDASQVVAHDLFADQVGLFDVALQVGVARKPCVVLVLLVITVPVCVERRGIHHPAVIDAVIEDQLVVDLQVVVRLVVVVVDVRAIGQYEGTVRGDVLPAVVVPASVALHVLLRDAVIGEVGLGLAAERYQFQHRIAVVIGTLEHVGFKIRGSAVDVAVRTDMGQACIHGPVAAHEARRNLHGLFVGVVRSVGERCRAVEIGRECLGGHVHRAAEGTRAVGRDACAALHLHRPYRRDQVGRVVPVHRVRVGVVHRNAVDRHVQARGVRAAQPYRGGADADAGFVGGDHRGGQRQYRRDVGSEAVAGDLVARDVRVGHGRGRVGACGGDFDLLQPIHAQRVFLPGLHGLGMCGGAYDGGRNG